MVGDIGGNDVDDVTNWHECTHAEKVPKIRGEKVRGGNDREKDEKTAEKDELERDVGSAAGIVNSE